MIGVPSSEKLWRKRKKIKHLKLLPHHKSNFAKSLDTVITVTNHFRGVLSIKVSSFFKLELQRNNAEKYWVKSPDNKLAFSKKIQIPLLQDYGSVPPLEMQIREGGLREPDLRQASIGWLLSSYPSHASVDFSLSNTLSSAIISWLCFKSSNLTAKACSPGRGLLM